MRFVRGGVCSILAALTLACSGDGPSGPGPAAKLALRVQPSGAQVGSLLRTQPVVEIQDASGRIVEGANAPVTATVGGGSLKGTATVQAVNGVATFVDLEIGGLIGERTLAFGSSGLTGVTSQSFSVAAGPAKALRFTVSPSSDAQTMIALERQPVVQAFDADGNPTAFAASVTASVTNGNAAITGGSTANPNAIGAATFTGLTLGASTGEPGAATLQFAAPGLNPVSASVILRCARRAANTGTTMLGALAAGDCVFTNGVYHHLYTITPAASSAFTLTMDGSFRTHVLFNGPNEPVLYWGYASPTTSNRTSFGVLLPSGTTEIAAAAHSAQTGGNYSLRVDPRSTDVTCSLVLVASPLQTSQRLGAGDCTQNGFLGDFLYLGLPFGATVSAAVTTAAFQPYLAVWRESPNVRAASSSGTSSASVSYTNGTGTDEMFYVYVGHLTAGASGPYDLSVSITYPAASGVGAPAAIGVPRISPQEALAAALRDRLSHPK
jgi:hypothetical protein